MSLSPPILAGMVTEQTMRGDAENVPDGGLKPSATSTTTERGTEIGVMW